MSRSDAVFAVTLVFFILATVFVGMRMISRLWVTRKFDWDDGFMSIAWCLAFALSFAIMFAARHGLGIRDADTPTSSLLPLKRSEYVFSITYNPILLLTKTSILILYIRMSSPLNISFRRAAWALVALVTTAGIVLTFLNVFQCRPVGNAVKLTTKGEDDQCINLVYLYLCSAPVNVITDLAIVLLPLPIITGIRMEKKQKYVIVGTFCTGLFVAIVDVIRIAYLQTALYQHVLEQSDPTPGQGDHARPVDFAYNAAYSYMWSAIEVNTGLICASILVLKPLMKKINPKAWGSRVELPHPQVNGAGGSPKNLSAKGMRVSQEVESKTAVEGSERKAFMGLGILRANGVMHDLAPVNEESIQITEDRPSRDSITIVNPSSTSDSISSTLYPPGTAPAMGDEKMRTIDLADMDFMDFLALSEAEIDGLGQPPISTPQVDQDHGFRIVPQPAAVLCPMGQGELYPVRTRKRRMTMLTFGSAVTGATGQGSQGPDTAFSDFVNLDNGRALIKLSSREAFWPIISVSSLFFVWGFAYGLLGSLNSQIETVLNFSEGKSLAFYSAYWCGYLLGPCLVGYWVITRSGSRPFKATFICGLWLFACGAMAFWPSSVIMSFAGFFISNLMLAAGLSCLEVAANLFVAVAGPDHLSECRLNFAQAIQGVASVISPVLAHKALFRGVKSRNKLIDTEWCYLAVAIAVIALSVAFYYMPLNEVDDQELRDLAEDRAAISGQDLNAKIFNVPLKILVAGSGIFVMMMYLGAQESTSYFWFNFITQVRQGPSSTDAFDLQSIGRGIFSFSRFLAAGILYLRFPPRILLGLCLVGSLLCSILTIALPNGDGPVALGILVFFFEAPIFPTLFAITLRGMGKHTKLVSTGLVMAICGGGIWPAVGYAIELHQGHNTRYALAVVPAIYGVCLIYALGLNTSGRIRRFVDPVASRLYQDAPVVRNARQGSGDSIGMKLARQHCEVAESKGYQCNDKG